MSMPETFDIISFAKDMQCEIEFMEDPVEASLRATEALALLRETRDERLRQGKQLIIKAFGAYALKIWDEERGARVTLKYEQLTAQGECAGIGFVQNMSSGLRLQTLFIGLNDTSIEERLMDDDRVFANHTTIPKLVIPFLDIDELQIAA